MSDIMGTGHGSAHDWENAGSSPLKITRYFCRKCRTSFSHEYDSVPEIFEAMEIQNIPIECVHKMEDMKEYVGRWKKFRVLC